MNEQALKLLWEKLSRGAIISFTWGGLWMKTPERNPATENDWLIRISVPRRGWSVAGQRLVTLSWATLAHQNATLPHQNYYLVTIHKNLLEPLAH